ncbi:YggT family protein [Corynebacterium sp. 32222D000AT]|uniref:YggT family protein n=1 Tax=unclassified Corynebacterium TaxID=2624378 RepID=UPI002A9809E7|nr:YggT family protein [Mycobacteriaceae bacterium]MDY5830077.1 YggT family protein [Corynebacterium sp.]
MSQLGIILYAVLRIFSLALIVRIIIEMIQSFSRQFNPPRWFMMCAEPLFAVTDPPVKALRKVIPPLRLGGVALDMSIIVLFIILAVLMNIVIATMV